MPKLPTDRMFRASVKSCARCGQDHTSVYYLPFTNPPKPYTHYGTCPATEEPILCEVRDIEAEHQGQAQDQGKG